MTFITEFEMTENDNDNHELRSHILNLKSINRRNDLGRKISNSFGWQNPVNGNTLHHRLEIEAFPIDKWIEFEKRFYDALPNYDVVSKTRLINALTALMTYQGKPSGDTTTNPK